jgi:tetratricopeptide (TPR) repeat protein
MLIINQRLQAQWDRASDRRLIGIQAPAGYGKTTAAAWWAQQLERPAVWLKMEQNPNCRHVPTFLTTLATGLAAAGGLPAPQGECRLSDCSRISQTAFPDGVCVVIDDYHLVAHPDLDAAIASLLTGLTGLHRLIVTSRQALSLPAFARLEARREAAMITEWDLQFDVGDVARLLDLPPDTAAEIHQKTTGWVFALNLLADVRHHSMPVADLVYQERLETYLVDEILGRYPADLVAFMQVTALFDAVTIADCTAVGLTDAENRLKDLHRERLVLQQGNHFVYHALIRQVLTDRMPAAERQHWRLTIARHYFAQEKQACLSLYLAAEAWQEACQAIYWFSFAQWFETHPDKPIMAYWFKQLPGEKLQTEPWYLLVFTSLCWYHQEPEPCRRTSRMIAERFAAAGDRTGQAAALCCEALRCQELGDRAALDALMPTLVATRAQFSADHLMAQRYHDLLIEHTSRNAGRRHEWERLLAELFSTPPVTPLLRSRHLLWHLHAIDRYIELGEFELATHHLRQGIEMALKTYQFRGFCAISYVSLGEYVDLPPLLSPEQLAAMLAEELAMDPAFESLAVYYSALSAYLARHWTEARTGFQRVLDLPAAKDKRPHYTVSVTQAHLYLGRLLRQDGDRIGAQAAYRQAAESNPAAANAPEVLWHLALGAWDLGEPLTALRLLHRTEALCRERHRRYVLAQTLLLQAMILGIPPCDETRALVDTGGFRHTLARTFPEGLHWLEAPTPVPPGPEPLVIRTLGQFCVWVDGQEITWKRFNSQLLLLDLLIHPEGSTAAELDRRYWPTTGNPGLRVDVQALRQALEPASPARASQYVGMAGRHYRWQAPPGAYRWDAALFEALAEDALTADAPAIAQAARRSALALYRGPFAAGFTAYPAFAPCRNRLQQLVERLAP